MKQARRVSRNPISPSSTAKSSDSSKPSSRVPGLARVRRELAERSLADFIRLLWRHIDPTPFIGGWHIDLICSELEAVNRRTPFYDLARALVEMGYGDWHLQIYTPQGTPSLSGLVSKMAKLTVEESDKGGLRLRKYRPFPPGRSLTDGDLGPEGTQTPDEAEKRVSDSPARKEAA